MRRGRWPCGVASGLAKGLGQLAQTDVRIGEESPGGLGGGEGLSDAGEGV